MAETEKAEIKIRDGAIHCASCEARIKSVVSKVDGVAEVSASEETQTVTLTFDPARVSVDDVRAQLDDIGYASED